jgi:hypothetical protein
VSPATTASVGPGGVAREVSRMPQPSNAGQDTMPGGKTGSPGTTAWLSLLRWPGEGGARVGVAVASVHWY